MERLKIAFTKTPYLGVAHKKFEEYLRRCWKVYDSKTFQVPYETVVQSSGFGKSRMLFELARKADNPSSQVNVIYTCVRVHQSTWYPATTTNLRNWLLPSPHSVEKIASRLEAIYNYAMMNWAEIQAEWIKLFYEKGSDESVRTRQAGNDQGNKKAVPSRSLLKKKPDGKMVVLMFDEARSLLNEKADPDALAVKVNEFRLLRRALALVNDKIGAEGGIFGVFVDTSPRISNVSPSLAFDPSSRNYNNNTVRVTFSPFVLTHTMDAHWREYYLNLKPGGGNQRDESKSEDDDMTGGEQVENHKKKSKKKAEIAAYKTIVTGSEDDAWNALQRMGRPMWWSNFTDRATDRGLPPTSADDVVSLAANKLLLGLPPLPTSYNQYTMFGAASMLCRLGVRLYSTSTLASQLVADFMAVLAYVNFESEGHVISYASDPVLALGAIKAWHAVEDGLSKYILPQLKKLILNEVLDTGGIGEMVARILLLLAMDTCVKRGRGDPKCQFVSVGSFLDVIGCNDMPIYRKGMYTNDNRDFKEWKAQWKDWRLGFTHFIQLLAEPNEDTLWYLLGRRASGIFPRHQLGADLIIPVFWKMASNVSDNEAGKKEHVSFVLVQVGNQDKGFSLAASKTLYPWTADNPLSKTPVRDVIRISMNLREQVSSSIKSFRFIDSTSLVKDNCPRISKGEDSDVFTVCFRSLCCETYPFLKEDVAQCLSTIVASEWDPMALVNSDLKRRCVAGKSIEVANFGVLSKAMPGHELKVTVLQD